MTVDLLLDNSAWARLGLSSVDQPRAQEIAEGLEQGRIAVCLPFLLEAGYSARTASDHADLIEQLRALPFVHIDKAVEDRVIEAQTQLARAGHHRLPPVDLIVASLADRHGGLGILHYDGDYDVIRAKTDLEFESVWLAERGSL